MEESPRHAHHERATVSARFFNRLHRYKNLVEARWWILALGILLAGGAESYFVWNAPQKYESNGSMVVSSRLNVQNAAFSDDNNANFLGTTLSLLQNETISNTVIGKIRAAKPDLLPTKLDFRVTVSPRTEIFSLRAIGTSAPYAQAFLEGVMDEFILVKKGMASSTAKSTDSGLQNQIDKVTDDLNEGRAQLNAFQSNNPVVLLQEQGNGAGAHLAELTKQKEDLQMRLGLLKVLTVDENVDFVTTQGAKVSASGKGLPNTTSVPSPDQHTATQSGNNDNSSSLSAGDQAEFMKAKQNLALLENMREEWGKVYREKHPRMKALDENITRQKSLLALFGTQIKGQLASQQHALELEIAVLIKNIEEAEGKALDASRKIAAYQTIKESNQRFQNTLDTLMSSKRSVMVTEDTSQDAVKIFEHATVAKAVPPAVAKHLSLAGLVGLILGIAVLLALDRLDDRPSSYTELEDLFDETILGQIPLANTKDKKAGAPILQPEDDRHALVEAYRNLRSSIVFMSSPLAHPKTIVLTSAIPGDGKSMTSANLAITIARAGSKILLVDADLRRGVMHKHFSIPNEIGFADVLMEKLHWSKAMVKTDVPNLDVIPRGAVPRHPGELFMTKVKDAILKETAEKYDFVLFDTPPVMAADDVSNLAPYVDGVIMVIRANYTSGRVARAALDLLYMRKINVLGLNFNGVRINAGEYYYYKYKEYYAKYPAAK